MKPEIYAKAMFDLAQSGKSADSVVSGVVKSLKARGAMALLPKILSAYTRAISKASTKGATLTVAREADSAEALKLSGTSSDAKVVVDESLIGGYRLEEAGKLLDNSFKAKLLQAYRNATKA
jgi:F0F1-type ATP synthase delta subunit